MHSLQLLIQKYRYTEQLPRNGTDLLMLLRLANEYNLTDLLAACESIFLCVMVFGVHAKYAHFVDELVHNLSTENGKLTWLLLCLFPLLHSLYMQCLTTLSVRWSIMQNILKNVVYTSFVQITRLFLSKRYVIYENIFVLFIICHRICAYDAGVNFISFFIYY